MKKFILCCLLISLGLSACSSSASEDTSAGNTNKESTESITIVDKKTEEDKLIEEIRELSYQIMDEEKMTFTHTQAFSRHISVHSSTGGMFGDMSLKTVKGTIDPQEKTGRFEIYSYLDLRGFDTDSGDTVDKFDSLDASQGTLDSIFVLNGDKITVENGTFHCVGCLPAEEDPANPGVEVSEFTYDQALHASNLNTDYFNYSGVLSNWILYGTYVENDSVKVEKNENEEGVQYIVTATVENAQDSPTGSSAFTTGDHTFTEHVTNTIQLDKKGRVISCKVQFPYSCDDTGTSMPNLSIFTIEYSD